jgi:hypothetical protein
MAVCVRFAWCVCYLAVKCIMRSGAGDGWAIAIAIAIVKEIKATWVSQVVQAGSGDSRVSGCGKDSERDLLITVPRRYDCQGRDVVEPRGRRCHVLGNKVLEAGVGQLGQDRPTWMPGCPCRLINPRHLDC